MVVAGVGLAPGGMSPLKPQECRPQGPPGPPSAAGTSALPTPLSQSRQWGRRGPVRQTLFLFAGSGQDGPRSSLVVDCGARARGAPGALGTHSPPCLLPAGGLLGVAGRLSGIVSPFRATRDEALFHCTEPSGVPRGPSQMHSIPDFSEAPLDLPEITGTSRGNQGFPAPTRKRPRESFFNAS